VRIEEWAVGGVYWLWPVRPHALPKGFCRARHSGFLPPDGHRIISSLPCSGYNKLYILKGASMNTMTYSAARASLASTMDKVCQDHEPMIITRAGQQAVVMLSLEDFKSMEETSYLLRSPENARRLLSSVTALAEGKGKERQLAK
jgi:antitoxin YefM